MNFHLDALLNLPHITSVFGRPTHLQVPRRQFYCRACQKYFTEALSFLDWERRSTQRYEDYIYHQVQANSIEQVSRTEALSWDQVQGIFMHKFNHRFHIMSPINKELNQLRRQEGMLVKGSKFL